MDLLKRKSLYKLEKLKIEKIKYKFFKIIIVMYL